MGLVEESFLTDAPLRSGVRILSDAVPFEVLYERARSAEKRILTDEQVAQLPDGSGLWNAEEWRIRARSAGRLLHELRAFEPVARILEVGCGNGWLSAKLQREGYDVLGIDAFTAELEQAARVFNEGPQFARADLFHSALPKAFFDVNVFAASFQYFPDAAEALEHARSMLRSNGEIHVIDTILYRSPVEAAAATERSRNYYAGIGVPEMTDHYHAHTLAELKEIGHLRVLSAPSGMDRTLRRFGREASPFTHVVITAQ